jgi:hypothetical protein
VRVPSCRRHGRRYIVESRFSPTGSGFTWGRGGLGLSKCVAPKKTAPLSRGVRSLACVWRSVFSFLFNDTVSGWAILLTRTHAFFESLAFLPSPLWAASALSGCYISNGRANARASSFDVTCCIWDMVQV